MPIPFASLDRYATRYGIEGADFEVFVKLIAAMDAAFIAAMNDKKAREGAGHGCSS